MRSFACSLLIGVCLLSTCWASAVAQSPAKQPAPAEQKKDEAPPPSVPPPEAKPYVPDEGKVTVSYALALLVVLMILLLVCMPARRE